MANSEQDAAKATSSTSLPDSIFGSFGALTISSAPGKQAAESTPTEFLAVPPQPITHGAGHGFQFTPPASPAESPAARPSAAAASAPFVFGSTPDSAPSRPQAAATSPAGPSSSVFVFGSASSASAPGPSAGRSVFKTSPAAGFVFGSPSQQPSSRSSPFVFDAPSSHAAALSASSSPLPLSTFEFGAPPATPPLGSAVSPLPPPPPLFDFGLGPGSGGRAGSSGAPTPFVPSFDGLFSSPSGATQSPLPKFDFPLVSSPGTGPSLFGVLSSDDDRDQPSTASNKRLQLRASGSFGLTGKREREAVPDNSRRPVVAADVLSADSADESDQSDGGDAEGERSDDRSSSPADSEGEEADDSAEDADDDDSAREARTIKWLSKFEKEQPVSNSDLSSTDEGPRSKTRAAETDKRH